MKFRNTSPLIIIVCLVLALSAKTIASQTQQSEDSRELPSGQTLDREMAGAGTHHYKFDLQANEFFQVRVEQKGVDVTLKLTDASGNVLATMDSPNDKQGPETLSFVAEKAGWFVLEVSATDSKAGKGSYSIGREAPHAATAKDRRRVEVERLFAQGIAEVMIKGEEETALKELSEAEAGWKDLADDYMEKLTAQTALQIIVNELNKDLQTAGSLLRQGQRLSSNSKADSLTARAKLNEALKASLSLNAKLNDSALVEKASRLGAMSQQILNSLNDLRFLSKLNEGLSLNAIGQTYFNASERQEWVDYLKLSLVAYEDAIKLLHESNSPALNRNQKQYLLSLKDNEAGVLGNIGAALDTLGRPEEALTYLKQALEQIRALYQEPQDSQFTLQLKTKEATTLFQMGLAYSSEARNRKTAIDFYSRAIEVFRTLPNRKAMIARGLDLIGGQYQLDFEYDAALKNWDEALAIYRELNDMMGQAGILMGKETMYYILDDKAKVREIFTQLLPILTSQEYGEVFKKSVPWNPGDCGVCDEAMNNTSEFGRLDQLGLAYQELGDYDTAIEYYDKALMVHRGRKDSGGVRSELRSISNNYARMKKWDKALEYSKDALEISRSRTSQEAVADDAADVGLALLELGKTKEALTYQDEALSLYQSVGIGAGKVFSLSYVRLLNELARTQDTLGNRRLAIFFGKQGVNGRQGERTRLRRTFNIEDQKGFLRKIEKDYRQLADWLIAEGRISEAQQVLAMLKEVEVISYLEGDGAPTEEPRQSTTFDDEERTALVRYNALADKLTILGAQFGKLQTLRSSGVKLTPEQENTYKELSGQIEVASNGFQVFLKQLADEFAQRSKTREDLNETLALRSKLRSWGKGVVFLYTLAGDDRYRVILVTPDAQVDAKYEIRATELDAKIQKFRQAVENPRLDPRPSGKELYNILIKPIEKQLEGAGAKTLLWSLDGSLRLLPLAALWDGQRYFGQKYQNVTITLASQNNLSDPTNRNWQVLAAAVSQARKVQLNELGTTREVPFSALPFTLTEVRSIVKSSQSPKGVLPGQALIDGEFNEASLESQLLRGYRIVHIASHLNLDPKDATRSFLLLGDGSVLTVSELRNKPGLKLEGVELLTLSACQTAVVGKDNSGREIEGFGYVAQQRGAKAVLATLWGVADESTQLLMSEFYRLHKQNPRWTKSEALQLAQQEMLSGKLKPSASSNEERTTKRADASDANAPAFPFDPNKPYSHPYYWSPFVLIGNWR
ncbi:MAG: hypothetical protein JWM21_2494 [Acidobacteria bacterium]|nr:hypothetical protein [Acidobacteriota bacterium]